MWLTLLHDLQNSYSALQSALNASRQALSDESLPFFDPTNPTMVTEPLRQAFIGHALSLQPSPTVTAGLLCASSATIEHIEQLNHAKNAFKEAVCRIRVHEKKDSKTRIDQLIERLLKEEGRRGESLRAAFRDIGFQGVDLLRCYANLRILPQGLESISWTWAKKHASIIKISKKEALALAAELPSPSAQTVALRLLEPLAPNTPLVMRKLLPNQLRANIKWQANNTVARKAITISGVVISPHPKLPQITWRDNPGPPSGDRMIREDRRINPEPFIKSLNIHSYLT